MEDQSRGRLFFDEVVGKKQGAFAFLSSLLKGGEAASENGWRDYKEAAFIGQTDNPDSDNQAIKSAWSENLSAFANTGRSEEHTSELQSQSNLVCRLLLE